MSLTLTDSSVNLPPTKPLNHRFTAIAANRRSMQGKASRKGLGEGGGGVEGIGHFPQQPDEAKILKHELASSGDHFLFNPSLSSLLFSDAEDRPVDRCDDQK